MEFCYFDAHCDTLMKIAETGGELEQNAYQVDFERLSSYRGAAQVFAVFNEGDLKKRDMLFRLFTLARMAGEHFTVSANELEGRLSGGMVSALASIEGMGNQPDFSPEDVRDYAQNGVRIMSLTWNQDNPLCGGIVENSSGLTALGKRTLDQMKQYRVIPDVSHASEQGFWDILEYWNAPLTATHSNARAICSHSRNLTDEQFLAICKSGSVVGINLYPLFLNGTEDACVEDVVRHIEHFAALGGEDHIGMGGDLDGITCSMRDVDSCEKVEVIFNRLLQLNYTETFIQKLSCRNFIELLKKYE